MVELALREDAYNQNWNIPPVQPITGEEIIDMLLKETGYGKSVKTVTKTMIQFAGIFRPLMREMVELMYLTEDPIILSGEKYESEIGNIPRTSYNEGIKATLKWMSENKNEFTL